MSCTRELSNIGLRADNQKGILLPSQPAPLEMPGDQESVALRPVRRKRYGRTSTSLFHLCARCNRASRVSEMPSADVARPHHAGIPGHRPAYVRVRRV
jgi:hypothetical protein